MTNVVSIRIQKRERDALEAQAKARGETLGSYCRGLLERGLEADALIYAVRCEVRASVERSEEVVKEQAKAVQGLLETLHSAIGAGA